VLCEADALVMRQVSTAGEAPLPGADGRALARSVRARGKVDPVFIEHPRELRETLPPLLRDGDLVLLLGAGDIGAAAVELAQRGHLTSENAA
jgi:UDP-N-acetylmuramate--alanine ligase